MKRFSLAAMLALLFLVPLCGCGDTVAGTWYSDRDDGASLVLNEDGSYSDNQWLTTGTYTVEEGVILLTSPLDGETRLTLQEKDGNTVLLYEQDPHSHTYYKDPETAKKAKEARQAAEKAAAEAAAAKEREALQTALVGYWYSELGTPVEFTADGFYISYTQGERQALQYEVLSGDTISVTAPDGSTQMMKVTIGEDGLLFHMWNYFKAEPLALSLELLEGHWTGSSLGYEFTLNGSFIEKSAFPGFVDDVITSFTITGFDTIEFPEQGRKALAFLSETQEGYQLTLAWMENGLFRTNFMTKSK